MMAIVFLACGDDDESNHSESTAGAAGTGGEAGAGAEAGNGGDAGESGDSDEKPAPQVHEEEIAADG